MTTEQATKMIASIYEPESVTLTKDESAVLYSNGRDRLMGRTPRIVTLQDLVAAIHAQAREWNWSAVTKHLNSCYAILGAPAPDLENPGYAFHCGEHPVQQMIARKQWPHATS